MISRKNVQHIAHLARIELTPEEEQKFEKELSAILEFVGKLSEVDTNGVLPMTGGTSAENIMRRDETVEKSFEEKQAEMLAQVPEKKGEWVKVKAIFK